MPLLFPSQAQGCFLAAPAGNGCDRQVGLSLFPGSLRKQIPSNSLSVQLNLCKVNLKKVQRDLQTSRASHPSTRHWKDKVLVVANINQEPPGAAILCALGES